MGASKARKRRHRRAAKAVMRHGKRAKRAHKKIAGRTGSVWHKKMKAVLAGIEKGGKKE